MKALKSYFSASCLILIITLSFSCGKNAENVTPPAESDNISFTETTPALGALPFVARARSSNPVLMAKRDGKIYVFLKTSAGGDFNTSGFTYDVNTNSLVALKNLSTGMFINSNGYNSTLVSIDASPNLWYSSTNISLTYSINTDSWASNNPLAHASANGGVCAMLSKVYYAGNYYAANVGPTASDEFNYYDITKYKQLPLAKLPYLVENPALQSYNNQFIYAIGGESVADGSITRKFSVYNVTNDAWTTLSNLPFDYYASSNNHSTTILKNKYLLAYSNNKVYLYNLETKQWNNNAVVDLGREVELVNINIFSNSTISTDDGDAFYLAGININGEFKIKKYTIK